MVAAANDDGCNAGDADDNNALKTAHAFSVFLFISSCCCYYTYAIKAEPISFKGTATTGNVFPYIWASYIFWAI